MSEQTSTEGLEFVGNLPSARIKALVKADDIEQAALVTGRSSPKCSTCKLRRLS
jgi:arginine deiminase